MKELGKCFDKEVVELGKEFETRWGGELLGAWGNGFGSRADAPRQP